MIGEKAPAQIWLENENSGDGRLWCEDNVWDEGDATRYVRADLAYEAAKPVADGRFTGEDVDFLNNEWFVAGYEKGKADALALTAPKKETSHD